MTFNGGKVEGSLLQRIGRTVLFDGSAVVPEGIGEVGGTSSSILNPCRRLFQHLVSCSVSNRMAPIAHLTLTSQDFVWTPACIHSIRPSIIET